MLVAARERLYSVLTPASPARDHWDACSRISAAVHGCSQTRSCVDGGVVTISVVVVAGWEGADGAGGGGGTDVNCGVTGSPKNPGGGGGGGGGGGVKTCPSIRSLQAECPKRSTKYELEE